MLRRLLIVPALALVLTALVSVCPAQVGLYNTWCFAAGEPPAGWVKVRKIYNSFLCPTDQNPNAWLIEFTGP